MMKNGHFSLVINRPFQVVRFVFQDFFWNITGCSSSNIQRKGLEYLAQITKYHSEFITIFQEVFLGIILLKWNGNISVRLHLVLIFFISENSEIFQENSEFLEYSQNRGILPPYFRIFQEYSLFSVNIPNYLKYSKQFGFRDGVESKFDSS